MTQKTRIALLVPMLVLAVVGTFFTLTTDAQADDFMLVETIAVDFEACVTTASSLCGEGGVSSFEYTESTRSCSFTCRSLEAN